MQMVLPNIKTPKKTYEKLYTKYVIYVWQISKQMIISKQKTKVPASWGKRTVSIQNNYRGHSIRTRISI